MPFILNLFQNHSQLVNEVPSNAVILSSLFFTEGIPVLKNHWKFSEEPEECFKSSTPHSFPPSSMCHTAMSSVSISPYAHPSSLSPWPQETQSDGCLDINRNLRRGVAWGNRRRGRQCFLILHFCFSRWFHNCKVTLHLLLVILSLLNHIMNKNWKSCKRGLFPKQKWIFSPQSAKFCSL